MGFKTMKSYNEERFGDFFLLRNDGDFADVIFMYQSPDDVLVADTHYIKSSDYSGYVHCCGRGCPACGNHIRVQTKLFIPLYNITQNELQFWDRSIRFENQLSNDVFAKFPNPSEYVFRVTRHGAAGDINTTYSIAAVGKNCFKKFEDILADNNCTFPAYYEKVCRDVTSSQLSEMLSGSASSDGSDIPEYTPTPRVNYTAANTGSIAPDISISATLPSIDDIDVSDDIDSDDIEDEHVPF